MSLCLVPDNLPIEAPCPTCGHPSHTHVRVEGGFQCVACDVESMARHAYFHRSTPEEIE